LDTANKEHDFDYDLFCSKLGASASGFFHCSYKKKHVFYKFFVLSFYL